MDSKEKNDESSLPSNQPNEQLPIPNDQNLPPNLFILPVNSPIVFPTLLAPVFISQPKLMSMVEEAMNRQSIFGVLLTRNTELKESVNPADLFEVGVAVKILKRLKLPDGSIHLLIHSLKRFKVNKHLSVSPFFVAQVDYLEDHVEKSPEMDALIRLAISYVKKLSEVNPFFTDEMRLALLNAPSSSAIADLIAFALSLPKEDAQDYLETLSVKDRLSKILVYLKKEQELSDLQKKINDEVNSKLNRMQRDFFLKEQLKSIKKELGSQADGEKKNQSFKERIQEAQMPEAAEKIALEELEKLEMISEHSPEMNMVRNYLDLLCSLPWNKTSEDNLDLKRAQLILDQAHFGLSKVKERIIEFLAVRNLKKSKKGSVICLVGPPGVGKTSIGKSIAETMGREFFRFSLGGMRDEAEIKGHRRTYVGAMPGKLIHVLKRVKVKNPVIMLDEIDKMVQSYHGDPASALLEVLDPEQNTSFLDHYLDLPFDLSEVLFITTANTTESIPVPLLDRMEVIEIPGYTLEEKEQIVRSYVLPKEIQRVGLPDKILKISKPMLASIIRDYAREAGLRSIQKAVQQICRKIASKVVLGDPQIKKKGVFEVTSDNVRDLLGPARFFNEMQERIAVPGVCIGLAWTAFGGEILFIEAIQTPGTGALKLTGQMGEVMLESASLAFSYVKKLLKEKNAWDEKSAKRMDLHVHIPAGAIPKDGPSAGIALATAMMSLYLGKKIRNKLAMTGELSLVGKVLAVGGIKEKLLAAHRAGIKTVLLPEANKKDLIDVPDFVQNKLDIQFVKHLSDVFSSVLTDFI